jgi:hypothetical protein
MDNQGNIKLIIKELISGGNRYASQRYLIIQTARVFLFLERV